MTSLWTQSASDLLHAASSHQAAPGGAGTAALTGAFGAALVHMAAVITLQKARKAAEEQVDLPERMASVEKLVLRLRQLADQDVAVFGEFVEATRLPRDTQAEQEERAEALSTAGDAARQTPLNIARTALEALHAAEELLPGTHAKWAQVREGRVTGFRTFMTGELYALLSRQSVLRLTIGEAAADAAAFHRTLTEVAADPGLAQAGLFPLRAAALLDGLSPEAAAGRLSALLIGAEIAGARTLYADLDGVVPLGAGPGAQAYLDALAALDIAHAPPVDADGCVRAGLSRAADILLQEFPS